MQPNIPPKCVFVGGVIIRHQPQAYIKLTQKPLSANFKAKLVNWILSRLCDDLVMRTDKYGE